MAGDKFLRNVAGFITEVFGTQTSAGAANAGDIVALGDDGYIDPTLLPAGAGPDVKLVQASENLAAGDLVNLHTVTGALRVRKADASTIGKEADGYVLAAALSGANASVYFDGINSQRAGLTPGANYWLSDTTPGGVTTTPPTGAGKISQQVGEATAATELAFEAGTVIVLA